MNKTTKPGVQYGWSKTKENLLVPFISITSGAGQEIHFTADIGFDTEVQVKEFVFAAYQILSGPQKNFEMGKESMT